MGNVLRFPVKSETLKLLEKKRAEALIPYRQSVQFKALLLYHSAKRRGAKLSRIPAWADEDRLKAIYKAARKMTKASGIEHHVDHYYPLQGYAVSGLHVPENLRIIPAADNLAKSNDLPDDPECQWPEPAKKRARPAA